MTPRLAIALGDPLGIGAEVTLKALAAILPKDDAHYVLLGDAVGLDALRARLGLPDFLSHSTRVRVEEVREVRVPAEVFLEPASAAGDSRWQRATLAWLRRGAELCLAGEADALVTAPVNKQAIVRSGTPFVGQTEFLSEIAGAPGTVMMLLGHDDRGRWLRVALATTHLALKDVPARLTQDGITRTIERAAQACHDLELSSARIGVCGLNPHAGEGGEWGDEEARVIAPAVAEARVRGVNATGPLPADTLFHQAYRGDFDAVVAMYHDQGLAPLKMVAFEHGVNWTLGLPFVRTSPDHGTAYDIAGRGVANPSSMIAAIHLAQKIHAARAAAKRPAS